MLPQLAVNLTQDTPNLLKYRRILPVYCRKSVKYWNNIARPEPSQILKKNIEYYGPTLAGSLGRETQVETPGQGAREPSPLELENSGETRPGSSLETRLTGGVERGLRFLRLVVAGGGARQTG